MAYSKLFKPEKYEVISSVIEAIGNLTPGRSISVSNEDPEARERTRYLVYDYFHHMNLKSKYQIKMMGTVIIIQRVGFKINSEIVNFGEELQQDKIHQLIDIWGKPEAEAMLKGWIEAKEISLEEGENLWEHVKRIMS